MPFGPHIIYTTTPYCLSTEHVKLPIPFVRESSLRDRNCTITIRDDQSSCTFALYSSGTHTYIRGTWRKFCIANCLEEGDSIMLEILANGKNLILRFCYLPVAFARSNRLTRRCQMILRDDKQRSWSVQLKPVGPRFAITKGWRQFREANVVKVGDTYKFELIDNGKRPVASFRSLIGIKLEQYLPLAFAKSNGLANRHCQMILRDDKQRSWSVQLQPMGNHIAITRGWRKFREANSVQVGDTYKFELIDNGTIPIAYFHCKYSGEDGIREAIGEDESAVGDVQGEQT
ncbi:unnamed protein product [Withania somnifera]